MLLVFKPIQLDEQSQTLYDACINCQLNDIKLLLDKQVNFNTLLTDDLASPLQLIILSSSPQSLDVLDYILTHYRDQIDIEYQSQLFNKFKYVSTSNRTNFTATPLIHAVRAAKLDHVKLLIKHNALVTTLTAPNRWSVLHCCAQSPQPYIMTEFFLTNYQNVLDINHQNTAEVMPIMTALQDADLETVKLLLEHKANYNFTDDKGNSPFVYCTPSHLWLKKNNKKQ